MTQQYQRAFALRDNPFGPTRPFQGIRPHYLTMLQTKPLRVYEEPNLLDLYCPAAGPFEKCITDFCSRIQADGYDPENRTFGMTKLIFCIAGQKGTGKTTLANVMIYWLRRCESENYKWKMFRASAVEKERSAGKQIEAIDGFKETVISQAQEGDYCCVIFDDLLSGADLAALRLFDDLSDADRIVFMFIITSDSELTKRSWGNSRYDVNVYKTCPLMPRHALAFVRSRITAFRHPKLPILGKYYLFPFDEDDVQEVLEQMIVDPRNGNGHLVTIRQLNVVLHRSLIKALGKLDPAFNLAHVAEKDIKDYIIHLQPSYAELVK